MSEVLRVNQPVPSSSCNPSSQSVARERRPPCRSDGAVIFQLEGGIGHPLRSWLQPRSPLIFENRAWQTVIPGGQDRSSAVLP